MQLILETSDIQEYLKCTNIIDFDHLAVRKLADTFFKTAPNDVDIARVAYEYVRDKIAHSADIQATAVTCTASEVLAAGHGICCSKSHLLAAVLRANGIPAGLFYQRLRTDDADPESPLIVHCLNVIYLHSLDRWIRVDARGNNASVNAQFSLDTEQLAWPVRREFGEGEDPTIYANPWPEIVQALQTCHTRTALYAALQMLWTPAINARFQ